MTLVAPCLERSPDSATLLIRKEIHKEVRFRNGGALVESGGRLRLTQPGGRARLLPGRLTVQDGTLAVSFGPWVQTICALTGHRLSQVSADFARGVAYRLLVTSLNGTVEASEQYFDGTRFRRAYPIRWSRDGVTLILRSALGELVVTPPVPLDWFLA